MTTEINTLCTCPSGDGSLRWPCPAHPPGLADALRHAVAELERSNAVMLREAGMGVTDQRVIDAGRAALAAAEAQPTKAERVHAIVNAGHFPGMSEAFDAHMGAACWTDPAYAPDASMWAAAWKASYQRAADGFRAQAARDTADLRMQVKAASNEPLTLDQIAALEAACGHQSVDWDARVSLVRAAEAAHGIGSKA